MRRNVALFLRECAASVRRSFVAHLPLYVCVVLFSVLTYAITDLYKAPLELGVTVFFLETVPKFFAVGLFLAAVVQFVRLARAGSKRPLREFGIWLRDGALSAERPGNIFHSLMTITPLMVSFNALKSDIPLIQPFSWDVTFSNWDRTLGFGRMPWEWFQPILGHPPVTMAIATAYEFWFPIMFGVLIWQAFFARPGLLRMQYLLAFAFAWFFGGNVLAVVFSSAGPCFYGYLHSPDPYAAQLAYLRDVNQNWPITSVPLQKLLWDSYSATKGANIGISAMPSMHVVMVTLMAILGAKTGKWLGRTLTVFAFVVVLGSVHLAWHYAVDAIAGIGLGFVFWLSAGALLRGREGIRALVWPVPEIAAASGPKDS